METQAHRKDLAITHSPDHPDQTQIQTQILTQTLHHHPIILGQMTLSPMSLDHVLLYPWKIQMGISYLMTKSQTIKLTNMIGTVIMTI
jgi:hypothetical protein